MVADGDNVQIGSPMVAKAKVEAEVISQGKGKKVTILKFRRRKHSMKTQGHRQLYTEIKITKIKA
jgi:large subunit ribosomal protein L21